MADRSYCTLVFGGKMNFKMDLDELEEMFEPYGYDTLDIDEGQVCTVGIPEQAGGYADEQIVKDLLSYGLEVWEWSDGNYAYGASVRIHRKDEDVLEFPTDGDSICLRIKPGMLVSELLEAFTWGTRECPKLELKG